MQSLCTPVLAATLLAFSSPVLGNAAAPAAPAAPLAALAREAPVPMPAALAASATLVAQASHTSAVVPARAPSGTASASAASDIPLLVVLGTALLVVVFVSLRRRLER
jgi:hypothetical protein